MSTLMQTFKDIGIDHYTAAKILATHPEVDINTMAKVVTKFEAAFLNDRDNKPIELYEEHSAPTDQFYDTVLMSVAETLKTKPGRSAEEILTELGVQELAAEPEHEPAIPAQVRSWSSRSEAKAETQDKNIEEDNTSGPKL